MRAGDGDEYGDEDGDEDTDEDEDEDGDEYGNQGEDDAEDDDELLTIADDRTALRTTAPLSSSSDRGSHGSALRTSSKYYRFGVAMHCFDNHAIIAVDRG